MDTRVTHLYHRNSSNQGSDQSQLAQNPGDEDNGNNPRKKGMKPLKMFLIILALLSLLAIVPLFLNGQGSNTNGQPIVELPYSSFYQQVMNGNVKETIFQGQDITGDFKNPISLTDSNGIPGLANRYHLTQIPNGDPNLIPLLNKYHVQFQAKPAVDHNLLLNIVFSLLPFMVVFGVIFFISRRVTKSQQNVFSFGKTRAKVVPGDRPSTTFADVAGVDEAKYDLVEVVEFLKTPEKFQRLGGKIPRGVLLVGPPGTGKTLLARAVAGEARVQFFSMSGSEFVEVLVGVGASRVRDLFDQAKKAAPSIIFIDEIDAVGRQRGTSINSNDEREQTLNQLLVERPDWNGRLAILKIHTLGVPLAQDVDLITIARATPGMVGADIANLVNEAALLAARRNLIAVTQNCFDEALDKILIGAERPLVLSEADLNVVACHESGHALTGLLQENVDPVTKVTIVPRGQALGVTQYTPLDDRCNYSKEYLEAQLVTALGGRAAEQVAIGHITTGAENDLQHATSIARQMVTRWGMSERLGTISYSERDDPFAGPTLATGWREYSEQTASIIDEEVNRIVKWAYDRAVSLLTSHRETLDGIAHSLRMHETLDARQLRAILEDTSAVHPGQL
jgi:cell division protease FtsH